MLIAVATYFCWSIFTIDVKTAFLNEIVLEEQPIHVKPPTDPFSPLEKHEGMSYKLKKSLYGLKQAPRVWNETLKSALTKLNFTCSSTDLCVYTRTVSSSPIIMVMHVDDIIITGAKQEAITKLLIVSVMSLTFQKFANWTYFLEIPLLPTLLDLLPCHNNITWISYFANFS